MTKNVSLTAGNKDGVANKRTHGVGEWMRLAALVFAAAFCLCAQSGAFAESGSKIHLGVIAKESTGTEYGKRVTFKPGRIVIFLNYDGVQKNSGEGGVVKVKVDGTVGEQLIPKANIATSAQFKKVTKWTGDTSAGCDLIDISADHKITRSGATTSEVGDESGTEDFKGHLYRFGNIVWVRYNHNARLADGTIYVVTRGGHLCAPNCYPCED